jgi:hypothetical protein
MKTIILFTALGLVACALGQTAQNSTSSNSTTSNNTSGANATSGCTETSNANFGIANYQWSLWDGLSYYVAWYGDPAATGVVCAKDYIQASSDGSSVY